MTRWVKAGLGVVAACAAVLSFSGLFALAESCGFDARLSWLLPVVVDVGAAVSTSLWIRGDQPGPAVRFARGLALTLMAGSVAGNAASHGLAAYSLQPPWWVVVIVSAVAPAVLGAVVHLVHLSGRHATTPVDTHVEPVPPVLPAADPAVEAAPDEVTPEQHPICGLDADDDDAVITWAVDRLRREEHAGAGTLHKQGVQRKRAERLAAQARQQHADEQKLRAVR